MLRLGLVAGESSGDLLGAGLIDALRRRGVGVQAEGIAGPRMIAAGCRALYPLERLSVMGLIEVLGRYRELHAARERLVRHWLAEPPDAVVGIDAPDFTLALEERLRRAGIRTMHYVSPQVWAWRAGRVAQIRRAADHVLVLFPFEESFYRQRGIAATCVGHPLADRIPLENPPAPARVALDLPPEVPIVGVMPGSRAGEIERHWPLFLQTLAWCRARMPAVEFVVGAVHAEAAARIRALQAALAPALQITVVTARAREVLQASEIVLCVSGTVTLEAMLVGRPMVVAYRMSPLSWPLVRRMVRVAHCALPNLLLGERRVPEFVQGEARPERLGQALLDGLQDTGGRASLLEQFRHEHLRLRRNADETAADTLLALVRS